MEHPPRRHGGTEERRLLAFGCWLLGGSAPASSKPKAKSQKPRAFFVRVSVPSWWIFADDRPEAA